MDFDYPKNVRFACSDCGICCGDTAEKTRHILLTKKDAERIAQHTKQAVTAFAHETKNKAPYILEMRKKAENGKCVFHRNNRCNIYQQRPLICRFYPFELATAENGKNKFTATTECPSVVSQKPAERGKKLGKPYFRMLLRLACAELGFVGDSPESSC